jgi:hemolysin III
MNSDKPLLRGHFHQAMFFISLGACSLLVAKCKTDIQIIAALVYSLGVLTMFGVSALYHRVHWSVSARLMMKRLDHSGIYVMIAGTMTPICLLGLAEPSRTKLLVAIWIVAIFGIVQSLFFVHAPKALTTAFYLLAGYMVAPFVSELLQPLGMRNVVLLIAGGVVYSLGALTYGFRKPALNPRIFGYHELFHVLVSIAAVMHFIVIYSLV